MNSRAEIIFYNYRNASLKVDLPANKLLLPSKTSEEKEQIERFLENLKTVLSRERVQKRSARSKIDWLNNKSVGRVSKIAGSSLNHFGYQNKEGKFLYPEEILYLIETNRVELFWGKVPITVQLGYEILLKDATRYKLYRKLALDGFRIGMPAEKMLEEPPTKRCKSLKEESKLSGDFAEIFEKLREDGPKQSNRIIEIPPDYTISTKSSSFNLYIINDEIDPKLGFLNPQLPTLLGIGNNDLMGFYRLSKVELPNLA